MDNKFHVSLEAARLLKEKGYNEECNYVIDDDGDIFEDKYRLNQDLSEWKWSCPTKAEAIDWLESKGFYVDLLYTLDGKWNCVITIPSYGMVLDDMELFDTRLEAEEAAIIKALELL